MVADLRLMLAHYHVRFLGDFRIESLTAAGLRAPLVLGISGKTRELFAFFLLNANKNIRRSALSNLIWSEQDERRSRANLNTALWRINRFLKGVFENEIALEVGDRQLMLRVAPTVLIDVVALETCVKESMRTFTDERTAALGPAARETLIDILSDSCDGFLESLSSEWVLVERERFFNLQIRGLTLLMQDLAELGRIEEALEQGRRILRMDPMRECVQRQVMWLHVLNGHQANAIRQYAECARILKQELGVAPMPETRALYEFLLAHDILGRETRASSGAPARPVPSGHPDQSSELRNGGYDQELTRLRGLLSRLNTHRQSVFSALAERGIS
jgi:DNA-binding SARP family transcriptional activator